MATAVRPARTTRLSSGSTQKRNYAADLTSSSSEDEKDEELQRRHRKGDKGGVNNSKKARKSGESASAVGGGSAAAHGKASHRSSSSNKLKRRSSKYDVGDDDEEDSGSDFIDDDAGNSSSASAVDQDILDEDVDDDSDGGIATSAKRSTPKGQRQSASKIKTKSRASNEAGSSASAPARPRRRQSGDDVVNEVTQIVRAPSEPVPKDRISPHTLRFMIDMQDPLKNDRDWFAVHKSVFDWCHQNWLDFTETCVDTMIERVDDTVAWMPPRDLVERIYRDVRFSNDKTPYKRHLSWCLSRNGKKGSFAKYYLSLMGNDKSGLYAGVYDPSKEDLDTIRRHILNKTAQGRAMQQLVTDATFCKYFGAPPKTPKDTRRTSLWNSDDELKRAPKGYEPDHPQVHWLRLKSFTVGHHFTDKEMTSDNFLDRLAEVARAAQPLIEIANEMLHGAPAPLPANGA